MSDLIDRLRYGHGEQVGITDEAADEIERLQAQITSMTKDMESIKPWRELQRENEELRVAEQRRIEAQVCCTDWEHCIRGCVPRLERENEELRKELQQARHDLMVRETAKDDVIAGLKIENDRLMGALQDELRFTLKAKQESAEKSHEE